MMSGVLGIQLLGILFGLLMIYTAFLHSKRNEFSGKETLFWIITWVVFIFITIFPRSIDFLAKDVFNVSRTMDFLIITGFIVITGLLFNTYSIVRKNQGKVEQIVREIALREAKKNNTKK